MIVPAGTLVANVVPLWPPDSMRFIVLATGTLMVIVSTAPWGHKGGTYTVLVDGTLRTFNVGYGFDSVFRRVA